MKQGTSELADLTNRSATIDELVERYKHRVEDLKFEAERKFSLLTRKHYERKTSEAKRARNLRRAEEAVRRWKRAENEFESVREAVIAKAQAMQGMGLVSAALEKKTGEEKSA